MSKRRFVLLLLSAALLAVVIVRLNVRSPATAPIAPDEPAYGGRTLSQWIQACGEENSPSGPPTLSPMTSWELPKLDPQAHAAIVHIGTNAIPFLLQWIRYEKQFVEQTTYQKILELLPNAHHEKPGRDQKEVRSWGAVGAFGSLGPEAVPAIPQLSQILNATNAGSSRDRAAKALACIGQDGLGPLLATLTNGQNEFVRLLALESIGSMSTNARPAVPILIEYGKDREERYATLAVIILGHMKLEPTIVVPALLERLQYRGEQRLWAASALGRFGQEARAAVPALVKMLNDPDPKAKEFASDALRKIDPKALESATR